MSFKLETLSQSISVNTALKARGELETEYYTEEDLKNIHTKQLVKI